MLSTWVIKSDSNIADIRDYLLKFVDDEYKLLVLKLSNPGDGAWHNLSPEIANWFVTEL